MSNRSTGITVGLDLGDKKIRMHVFDAADEGVVDGWIDNDRASLLKAFGIFPDPGNVTVAMETGSHSPWISNLLLEMGFRVLVGNARRLRAIWDSDNKNDERDAELLARMARFDPKLLSPIIHRGEVAHKDLSMLKARDTLVRSRTNLVNFVRGTFKTAGLKLPSCSTETFAKVVRENNEDESLWPAVGPVLEIIETLNGKIRELDRTAAKYCQQKYPETQLLQQVTGVGPVTALAFVLTLEDPGRFPHSRSVGPYLGLIPKRDQSGECDKPLPITKAGNAYLRRLLINAANYIMGPFGRDCDLRRHGERIASRGGVVARRKAKVAVARRLAVLLHHLWKSGDEYQPLYRSKRSKAA